MIGRALLRFPAHTRLLHPTTVLRCQPDVAARVPLFLAVRSYATPGRPKKIVGEPSRPVKRAVKKAASKPSTGDSPAETLVRSRKTAAKKKSTKKRTAKPKKLTPEQKAAALEVAALKKEKAKATDGKKKLAALRALALKPPKLARTGAYHIFLSEKMSERLKGLKVGSSEEDRGIAREMFGNHTREMNVEWRSVSAADLEHYNHLANEKKQAAQAEYKRWVASHPAEEIQQANNARAHLRRLGDKAKWPVIRDERQVKRPLNPYFQFAMNRRASGDFKNIAIGDASRLIAAEYKALSDSEKSKYNSLHDQDRDRYTSEYKDTYGRAPGSLNGAEAAAAAA